MQSGVNTTFHTDKVRVSAKAPQSRSSAQGLWPNRDVMA